MTDIGLRPAQAATQQDDARSLHRFDWVMTLLSLWFITGLFLDGWAHTHGQVDESFFTPWHAVLYSGHMAMLLALIARWVRGRALPPGYSLSMVGAVLYLFAGVGDFLWHDAFGVEESIEALLSPTHLVLAASAFLIVTGVLRAAWPSASAQRTLHQQMPALLSLTIALSVLTFFTQYASPIANVWALGNMREPFDVQEMGVVSMLLDTALWVGAALIFMRRWQAAPGAFTLLLGLNAFAMGFLFDQGPYPLPHVLVRVVAGLVADGLMRVLHPSSQRPAALRLFAFAVPGALYAAYFVVASQITGIAWSVHMWAGMVVLAGVAGLLMSFVSVPLGVIAHE